MVKPNGSLAYPQLAGALIQAGVEVDIFDATVGNEKDDLNKTFYTSIELPTGLRRTGVSDERILEEIKDSDVIGLTSIFSAQETMVLHASKIIKKNFPDKLIVAGGINARARRNHFFNNGVDVVCLSEAEKTLIEIIRTYEKGSFDFSHIPALSFKKDQKVITNQTKTSDVTWNLDETPFPAWHLMPNKRYWKIGRPHGGVFRPEDNVRFASLMTSLGCIFSCKFCHISAETEGRDPGPIGKFRIKSDERVLQEIDNLLELGVNTIYIEDDTLFGHKKRGMRLLQKFNNLNADFLCVNGLNIAHLMKSNEPDEEMIQVLVEAGVKEFDLPFESGCPRVLKKYANNKWGLGKFNIPALIKKCREKGIRLNGGFIIGFPDETREEMQQTLDLASRLREIGLNTVNISIAIPLPGTPLYDQAVVGGHLAEDYNIDKMHWLRANMINTPVPPLEIESIQREYWERLNDEGHKSEKKSIRAAG
jgi:radical SAM superfamily enzyme YgiQ (UPF0313 family)